ncbi:MAG: radical SAM protein [Syntrophorhabdaceae bacterium]|nr:radical SAM protein [Syntrophorhabdaceae bacterium]
MEGILELIKRCELCPRRCRVNRLSGETGACGVGAELKIAHYGPHFGEEPPISGTNGSGNIFFTACNMRCLYCQNYQISQKGMGRFFSVDELVDICLHLEEMGCHNINLVSPTPYIPFVAIAIERAREKGLKIPFVYNTNAYENVEALRLLEGLIDIYLPDFKYWSPKIARRLSRVPENNGGYPEHAKQAILEMKRQVGDLFIENGIAKKGLLLRHLVLPAGLSGTRDIILWIREHLGTNTYISLMSQYNPLHEAHSYPMINRRIRAEEYDGMVNLMVEHGFENVFIQEMESAELFVPDFNKAMPFN